MGRGVLKGTLSVLTGTLSDFCEEAMAEREPETSAQSLCAHIATYIRTLRKLDGTDYEPGSITSAHSSIERYLREKGYPYSIMGAPEFQMSRNVVEAKRTLLKKSGKGNKPNAQTALTKNESISYGSRAAWGRAAPWRFCLFVCGISLTSGQLVSELFPDCTRSCFSQVVLRRRGDDRIYEMRCLFVAVGLNARFIVLPHWDNMS